MTCLCGDTDCPHCFRDVIAQRRNERIDATVDDLTDRLINELDNDGWEDEE